MQANGKLIDEVLDGLRLRSTVFSRMTLAGDWGFAKDQLKGAPFHFVLSGRACLETVDGQRHALGAGDIAILPRGERHRLLARPEASAVPWKEIVHRMGWMHWKPGNHFKSIDFRYGDGEPVTTLISGVYAFREAFQNPLLAALPPVMLMRTVDGSEAARAMAPIATLLDAELLSGKPGAESVAARLADVLFLLVVRQHLAGDELPRGWLRGLTDPRLGPALALIHGAPERNWSVATLAGELAMSRSRFAARFRTVVGQGPMEYLTHWRMYKAAAQLADGEIALATLANSIGYRSEVSFGKAFKRWAGRSPSEYRRWLDADDADEAPGD